MTETQKRIKAYKAALPGLRERVFAVALLLAMSLAMMTSASFAWLTISRRPEVSGVNTTIASNGNLEIALATGDGKTPPGESKVGDSSATKGQSITASNITWGNLINLGDPSYGLDNLALRPAQLNSAALLTKPLYGAVYSADGRVKNLTTDYGYTAWIPADGNIPAHFGVSDDVGVRAISSIKREQVGFAGDYRDMYDAAEIANVTASNTYTAITKDTDDRNWMEVLAKLLGIHMTASLNSEDKYKNATIEPADMEALIAMYEEFLKAHVQEADAIAKMINLELFTAYGGNTEKYTPFTKEDILAINPNGGGRIQSNGDYQFDITIDGSLDTKTLKITNLKAFLKDYLQLSSDLQTLNQIHETKDYRWTASGLYKVVERLMNVNQCLIKKTSESSYQTIQELMNGMSSNPLSALGYMGSSCDIVITNGVLYNLEQRVGSSISIQGMKVTAKMYVDTMNLGEQTANITAYVTTSATKPSDFQKDLDYTGKVLNTGADTSSGEAVAEDTYALAVDFWVRTNALGSYLTLEGNVLLGEPYNVPITTVDANGNHVPLYVLTQTYTNEETNETYDVTTELYQKEENGTVVWYKANVHTEMTAEEMGDKEPVAQVEEKRDVIGYEGENRVWDKESKDYITADSTTQGVGSCYVYYADSPEDQARSLELLKYLNVAFVNGEGALLATASMDTENFYGNSGRFVVPLKVNNDGTMIKTAGDNGEEVIEYAITALNQNEPTRITAIVYLDGRELNNENVLSAADIQGQLNIQFGSNTTMQPIDNEKLEYETRKVSASVDNTSFDYDTHTGDMVSNITVHVDGDEPTNVKAFFQRKINATQGSRENEMIFTKNDSGEWVTSYKFTAPGEYILRSVYLDGMEYVLAEPPTVKINGFTITSLTCDQTVEGRHVDILTAANSSKLDLKLKFATDDEDKMPDTVQARFLRDVDGVAVNVNFTYNATTQIWSGSATFLNSGEYTLQYLLLNGEHTGLAEDMWITANVKLGMKVAVYTTDITNFKFKPDEMMANGTDQLHMQVKVMDNGGKPMPGLKGLKLTYRLKNSASTIDVDLTWSATENYYVGDIQALLAGPGIWEFYRVTIGEGNVITNATTYPVFEMLSPEPPSFVGVPQAKTVYSASGTAYMSATLKYSGTATVAAVIKDKDGRRYPVMGTPGTTENNQTTWHFTVPTNATGPYSGKQDGYWTLETIYLWNYYMADGTYVEWAKDESGKLKGTLSLNANGSLASNADRDDENAMVINVNASSGGNDYRIKVIQTVKVDFTSGQKSADFGKSGTTITGAFMDSYTISNLQVKITDFEDKAIGSDVAMKITYNNNTSSTYGGYTNNDLENSAIVFDVAMTADATGTTFTQTAPITLRYAGTYTTTFTFKLNGVTAALTNAGVQVAGELPQFTVSSVKPTVAIQSYKPSGQHNSPKGSSNNTAGTATVTSGVDATGRTLTIYWKGTAKKGGLFQGFQPTITLEQEPYVTLRLTGLGNASRAELSFVESNNGTVYLYSGTSSKEGTQVDKYVWDSTTGQDASRFVGYMDSGNCSSTKAAGTLNSSDKLYLYYTIDGTEQTFEVAISQADRITIIHNMAT